MRKNNNKNTVEAPEQVAVVDAPVVVDAAPKKRTSRSRKKVVAPVETEEISNVETPVVASPAVEKPIAEKSETKVENKVEPKPIPRIASNLVVKDFCDLANSGSRIPLLKDDQIQQLTLDEAIERHMVMEAILANVLDYDIVLSDTNIWLELLVGHISSHSDPRVNARLQFERQLEFISKMMKRIGGRFIVMSETYEEIDRFATIQEPTNYKDADWTDEVLCRNVAARLAKRLMLSQQKENRLRIVGIGSESHHGSFADPAIIRHTVELFAQGKKVLLLTNDASVGIRSLGMCDDLQRTNNVDDKTWRTVYEPQRPMVLTMDDLKLLDQYTRQYHYLMMAAGRQWMQNVNQREGVTLETPLNLWLEGFRPGDRHERNSDRIEQQRREEREKAEREKAEQQRREEQRKARQKKESKKVENKNVVEPTPTPAPSSSPSPVSSSAPAEPQTVAEPVVANTKEAPKETETAPVAEEPQVSFGATAEMMDLIGSSSSREKKAKTRRSSRRRNSGKKKQNPESL